MTVQAFQNKPNATPSELAEAEKLMEGINFKTTRECFDGYESWSREVPNMDGYVELIRRARSEDKN